MAHPPNSVQRKRLERLPPGLQPGALPVVATVAMYSHTGSCPGRVHPTGPLTELQSRLTHPCVARQYRIATQQVRDPTRCCHTAGQLPVCEHKLVPAARTRTCNLLLTRQVLSPLELHRHSYGRADGTRTHNLPLIWRTGYKPAALPLSYSPSTHFPNCQRSLNATGRIVRGNKKTPLHIAA